MIRLAAILIAVIAAALWLIWLWRDPDELPYIDDADWLMEVDPYIASLRRRA